MSKGAYEGRVRQAGRSALDQPAAIADARKTSRGSAAFTPPPASKWPCRVTGSEPTREAGRSSSAGRLGLRCRIGRFSPLSSRAEEIAPPAASRSARVPHPFPAARAASASFHAAAAGSTSARRSIRARNERIVIVNSPMSDRRSAASIIVGTVSLETDRLVVWLPNSQAGRRRSRRKSSAAATARSSSTWKGTSSSARATA